MAQIDNRYAQAGSARTDVVMDEGLRAYMLRVYNYMAAEFADWHRGCVRTEAVTTDGWRRCRRGRCALNGSSRRLGAISAAR